MDRELSTSMGSRAWTHPGTKGAGRRRLPTRLGEVQCAGLPEAFSGEATPIQPQTQATHRLLQHEPIAVLHGQGQAIRPRPVAKASTINNSSRVKPRFMASARTGPAPQASTTPVAAVAPDRW